MPDQEVYLDDNGNPIGPKVYLDDNGEPIKPAAPTWKPLPGGTRAYSLASARGEDPSTPPSGLMEMLRSAAHPQTLGDLMPLLLASNAPQTIGRHVLEPIENAAVKYGGSAADMGSDALHAAAGVLPRGPAKMGARMMGGALRAVGKVAEWNSPFTVEGRAGRAADAARAFNDLPLHEQLPQLPQSGPTPETMRFPGPPASGVESPAASAVPGSYRAPDPNIPRDTPFRTSAERRAAQGAPSTTEPSRVFYQGPGEGPGAAPIEPIAPIASHPLTQPRADVGAEKTGRAAGMSTQDVRNATGPVLGEEPGAASPILPRGPSEKILGKLKEMGPRGTATVPEAERDAYVMRANSDKARAQIKAYLDALRSVGFSGAAGVAARQALTSSMAPSGKD